MYFEELAANIKKPSAANAGPDSRAAASLSFLAVPDCQFISYFYETK